MNGFKGERGERLVRYMWDSGQKRCNDTDLYPDFGDFEYGKHYGRRSPLAKLDPFLFGSRSRVFCTP